jgi:hypothetical protein
MSNNNKLLLHLSATSDVSNKFYGIWCSLEIKTTTCLCAWWNIFSIWRGQIEVWAIFADHKIITEREINHLKHQVNNLKQQQIQNNVIIFGVPYNQEEDLHSIFTNITNTIKSEIIPKTVWHSLILKRRRL